MLPKYVAIMTSKGRIVLPKAVRQALGIETGGRVLYEIEEDGGVILTRPEADADPVIGVVLDFLCREMTAHPENILPISETWMQRMKDLVGHIEVDLTEPIEDDVDF